MSDDILTLDQRKLHRIDSNTLLRMYDRAVAALEKCKFQQERTRADLAVRRIAKELRGRKVTL